VLLTGHWRTERDLCPVTGFLKQHLTPTRGLHPNHSSLEDTTCTVRNHLLTQIYLLDLVSVLLQASFVLYTKVILPGRVYPLDVFTDNSHHFLAFIILDDLNSPDHPSVPSLHATPLWRLSVVKMGDWNCTQHCTLTPLEPWS